MTCSTCGIASKGSQKQLCREPHILLSRPPSKIKTPKRPRCLLLYWSSLRATKRSRSAKNKLAEIWRCLAFGSFLCRAHTALSCHRAYSRNILWCLHCCLEQLLPVLRTPKLRPPARARPLQDARTQSGLNCSLLYQRIRQGPWGDVFRTPQNS